MCGTYCRNASCVSSCVQGASLGSHHQYQAKPKYTQLYICKYVCSWSLFLCFLADFIFILNAQNVFSAQYFFHQRSPLAAVGVYRYVYTRKRFYVRMLVFVYCFIRLEYAGIPFSVVGIPPKSMSYLCPHLSAYYSTYAYVFACTCVPVRFFSACIFTYLCINICMYVRIWQQQRCLYMNRLNEQPKI